jgi:hypothetical protein
VKFHTTFFASRKLRLNIFGEEGSGRDASVKRRFLISLRRRRAHRLQNQFHTLRAFRRIEGQPAEWAHRNIFIFHESENSGVVAQRFLLVIH